MHCIHFVGQMVMAHWRRLFWQSPQFSDEELAEIGMTKNAMIDTQRDYVVFVIGCSRWARKERKD